jgi:hypothetical protein
MDHITGFIASLTAHDDTMAETVHARQFYNPEDLLHNVRFVDMIDNQSQPGVIIIDHSLLHEVRPISLTSMLPAVVPVASDADSEASSAATEAPTPD